MQVFTTKCWTSLLKLAYLSCNNYYGNNSLLNLRVRALNIQVFTLCMVANGERLLHQTHWSSKFGFEVFQYGPHEEASICDDLTHALNIQFYNSLSICVSQCASEPFVQQLRQTLWSSWLSVPKVSVLLHTPIALQQPHAKHVAYSTHTSRQDLQTSTSVGLWNQNCHILLVTVLLEQILVFALDRL